jgi:hypothetical protein
VFNHSHCTTGHKLHQAVEAELSLQLLHAAHNAPSPCQCMQPTCRYDCLTNVIGTTPPNPHLHLQWGAMCVATASCIAPCSHHTLLPSLPEGSAAQICVSTRASCCWGLNVWGSTTCCLLGIC